MSFLHVPDKPIATCYAELFIVEFSNIWWI